MLDWLNNDWHCGHLKGLISIILLISWTRDICSLIDFHKIEPLHTNYNQKTSPLCIFFDESWAVLVLKKCCCTIYIYDSLFQCEFWCALTNQLCQWKMSYSEHKTLTLLPGELSCGASMKFYWTYVCCIENICYFVCIANLSLNKFVLLHLFVKMFTRIACRRKAFLIYEWNCGILNDYYVWKTSHSFHILKF